MTNTGEFATAGATLALHLNVRGDYPSAINASSMVATWMSTVSASCLA